MNAVTLRGAIVKLQSLDGEELAVVDVEVLDVDALGHESAPLSVYRLTLLNRADEAGDQVQRHDDDDQGERRPPHPVRGVVDGDGLPVHEHVRVSEVADLVVDHAPAASPGIR